MKLLSVRRRRRARRSAFQVAQKSHFLFPTLRGPRLDPFWAPSGGLDAPLSAPKISRTMVVEAQPVTTVAVTATNPDGAVALRQFLLSFSERSELRPASARRRTSRPAGEDPEPLPTVMGGAPSSGDRQAARTEIIASELDMVAQTRTRPLPD